MRFTFMTLIFFLLSPNIWAQQGINYKAIISDDSGNIVVNSLVEIRFAILQGSGMTNVYSESHTTTTNGNGLINIVIGDGLIITGVFEDILWENDDHFLNVQVNTGGGLTDLGTTQFMPVPYALSANNVDNKAFSSELGVTRSENHLDDFVFGSSQLDDDPNTSDDNFRMLYDKSDGSFRVGYALGDEWNQNARGNYSVAMGYSSAAFAPNAMAFGRFANSSGSASIAMGDTVLASGSWSGAFGLQCTASGTNSFAIGYGASATAISSISVGRFTTASGFFSFATGNQTQATSYGSFALGRYNVGGGNPDVWNSSDPIFEIGIGQNNARNNAMTVLKNGNVGIGTHTPAERLHISGGKLRLGSETIEDTGNNRLSFNAGLFPDLDNSFSLGNSSFRWTSVWATDGSINTSDRRDKNSIQTIPYGLAEVLQMKPVTFQWNERPEAGNKLGLIAQDLQSLIPEVVTTYEDATDSDDRDSIQKKSKNRLGVYYSDLIPVLIRSIQEQQKLIEKQQQQINQLLSKETTKI